MTTHVSTQGLVFRDNRGHVGKTSFHYAFDNSVAANTQAAYVAMQGIVTEIALMSNAALIGVPGVTNLALNPLEYGASAQYANAETKAVLTFQTVTPGAIAAGYGLVRISIPAPKLSIFYGDQETVDPAQVATLLTLLTTADAHGGTACGKQEGQITAFLGGMLARRKFQRKLTIYDKSANLDEEEE